MTPTWKIWLLGIWSALLGGVATTIGVMIADPKTFNFEEWRKLLVVAGISGAVAVVNYLRQSPLPTAVVKELSAAEIKEIEDNKNKIN